MYGLGLTAHDVTTLSPKFWAMHTNNIAAVDLAPMVILTIQYNLAAGTIAPWAEKRPELRPILQKILDFEVSCVVQHALSSTTDPVLKGPIHVNGASAWVRLHPLASNSELLIQVTRLTTFEGGLNTVWVVEFRYA
jgi:hypothetical protein